MMKGLLQRNQQVGLVIAILVLCVDQLLKWVISGPMGLTQEYDKLDLLPFFDLYRIHNGGISFGLFEATSEEWRWFLVAITALIALVVLVWMLREKVLGEIIGLSMVLGGALGNIIDRARYGYVLDYADLHIGDFRPFLIFNVADAAITIGVLIILARSLFVSEKDKRV
jgi:signal peptidase II